MASLEEQVESRRQLARGVHGAEEPGGSYHQQQQQQQQWPEAENGLNLGVGKPSTVKHRFGVGNFQHSDMAIFANDGIRNNNNNNNNGGGGGSTGKRTFFVNPNDAYEGHQSNEPGVPFEVKDWIIEEEEGEGGGAGANFDAGGSMDGNDNGAGGVEHLDPLADVEVGVSFLCCSLCVVVGTVVVCCPSAFWMCCMNVGHWNGGRQLRRDTHCACMLRWACGYVAFLCFVLRSASVRGIACGLCLLAGLWHGKASAFGKPMARCF